MGYWFAFSIVFSLLSNILLIPILIYCERRLLGIFQLRLGVIVYFFYGLFVFICDLIKGISKFKIVNVSFNKLYVIFCIIFFLFLGLNFLFVSILQWKVYFFYYKIFILSLLGIMIFFPFPFVNLINLSNSLYSKLGLIRVVLVIISIELPLFFAFFIILNFIFLDYCINLCNLSHNLNKNGTIFPT